MSKTLSFARIALPLALLASSTPALGSLLFPEEIKKHLDLAEVPPPAPGCRVCHKTDEGGFKNVTKPFGRTMMGFGTTASSVPAMLAALDAAEEAGSDSDRDGTPDVTELREGTDPNVRIAEPGEEPLPPIEEVPLPETGCAMAARPRGATEGAGLAALAVAWLLSRRWRRRSVATGPRATRE